MKAVRVCLVATIGLAIALAIAVPAFGRPQEASSAPNPEPPGSWMSETSGITFGTTRRRRSRPVTHRRRPRHPFFFFSPSVSAKPSTGLSAGLASSIVFVAGDPETTHISSGDWAVNGSVLGQAGTSIRFRIFTPENHWLLQGDDRLAWTSQSTYVLGIVPDASGERIKYDRTRVYETIYRQIRPKTLVGVGLNLNGHTNIRPSTPGAAYDNGAYVAYSDEHGFATNQQDSNGVSLNLVVDTRDNAVNATRGWLVGTSYRTFFNGFLGGSSTWQRLETEARFYKALDRDAHQTIAFWYLGEFVTGGTAPYLDLPSIADDTYGRSARGYTTGRYRGPHMVYGEVEYRAALTRNQLVGGVLFANTTAIDDANGHQALFSSFAPATGAGVRLLLSKRSRSNLCLDYGWGRDKSRGLYLAMRETF